jgi:biopolymer transport protein TolQ
MHSVSLLFSPTLLPLGLIQSFLDSNFMGQAIVVGLLFISVYSWTALAYKFREFSIVKNETRRFLTDFRLEQHPLGMFIKQQRYPDSPTYRVYLRSCQSAARVLGLSDPDLGALLAGKSESHRHFLNSTQLQLIREAAERELAEQVLRLERDMVSLATVTTIAPFLGLLGTVWGVMDAFTGMAITGAPTLSSVAPGISSALLTTVIGLLVAIPTVIGFNVLSNMLRNETVGMDNFVQELAGEFHHAYLKEE